MGSSVGQGLSSLRGKNFSPISSPRLPAAVGGKPLGLVLSLPALVNTTAPLRSLLGLVQGLKGRRKVPPEKALESTWGQECRHEGSKQGLVWPSGREATGRAPRPCQLELGALEL